MALFRGEILHLRAPTRDVTFGTNVRSLLGIAGADTNYTVTFTAAATQTVNPYTNISNVTADNRINLGWSLNQNAASTDGMGSTATEKRFVPSGVWEFSNSITGTAPALLANYNVTIEYSVYRVAANGGTRTLLFSFSGAPINRTAAGTFVATASSPSQPIYVFEANETLHIAYRITSANTTAVLGASTNTVLTINGATSSSQLVTLPSPGLRTLYFDSNSSIGEAVGTESILTRKDTITGTGKGVGLYDYTADFFREFESIGEAITLRQLIVLIKDTITATGKGIGTRSNLYIKDIITSSGKGDSNYSKFILKDLISAEGESVADLLRSVVFVRDFLGEGESIADIARVVIFVRDFLGQGKGAIRPRIALDWDNLPEPGEGGGTTIINTYRPLFVFDD